jgi:hypothetical protein
LPSIKETARPSQPATAFINGHTLTPSVRHSSPAQVSPPILFADDIALSPATSLGQTEAELLGKSTPERDSNLSEKLWNRAYNTLEKEEAKLVKAYVRALVEVLVSEASKDSHVKQSKDIVSTMLDEPRGHMAMIINRIKEATSLKASKDPAEREKLEADVSAKLENPAKRQEFMEMLVENGKAKVSKALKVSETIGNVAGTILSIKPAVDIVLQIPQAAPAALPWAGICVGLEVSNGASLSCSQNPLIFY